MLCDGDVHMESTSSNHPLILEIRQEHRRLELRLSDLLRELLLNHFEEGQDVQPLSPTADDSGKEEPPGEALEEFGMPEPEEEIDFMPGNTYKKKLQAADPGCFELRERGEEEKRRTKEHLEEKNTALREVADTNAGSDAPIRVDSASSAASTCSSYLSDASDKKGAVIPPSMRSSEQSKGRDSTISDIELPRKLAHQGSGAASQGPFRDMAGSELLMALNEQVFSRPSFLHSKFASSAEDSKKLMTWLAQVRVNRLTTFVESSTFTGVVGIVIVLNAIAVAVAGDAKLQQSFRNYDLRMSGLSPKDGELEWIKIMNIIFCVFFSIELTLRILGLGIFFIIGDEWRWNWFDSVLVISSITTFLGDGKGQNMSFARMLRLVRLTRAMRAIRILKYFQETRVMLTAVLNALVPLLWSLVFVILVMFLFAVFMMSVFTEYIDDQTEPNEDMKIVRAYYDSFFMTMLSLFMCISGGKDWFDLGEVVVRYSTEYAMVYVFYIALMFLGLLNIINGVFVTAASDMSRMDRETATADESAKHVKIVKTLRKIFIEFDEDASGTLSWEEFQKHLQSYDVQAYLAALHINVFKAQALFKLLDVDESGQISLDEFVMGCLRLRGDAKTVDVATLMYETRSLRRVIHHNRVKDARNLWKLNSSIEKMTKIVAQLSNKDVSLLEQSGESKPTMRKANSLFDL